MDQKTITGIVVFFIILVVGMFIFAFVKKSEIKESEPIQVEEPTPEVAYESITRVDAKHYYVDGTHTLVGEILMPTPCDLLKSRLEVAESYPEQITLVFEVLNNSDTCVQKVTPQRFSVSENASPEATFSAVFMNRPVELNLIPAAPGERPEEFEVFNKG